ncbi:hypothetical protein J3F83DRAFT_737959 [Trichoderma novae-zelandiae]
MNAVSGDLSPTKLLWSLFRFVLFCFVFSSSCRKVMNVSNGCVSCNTRIGCRWYLYKPACQGAYLRSPQRIVAVTRPEAEAATTQSLRSSVSCPPSLIHVSRQVCRQTTLG